MNRFCGYLLLFAVVLTACVTGDVFGWPLFVIWLVGFPLACTMDLPAQGRSRVHGFFIGFIRVAAFLAWLPSVFLVLIFLPQIPAPGWLQGPDTSYAREHLPANIGDQQRKSLRNAYYFRDPTFVGMSDEFLRFDFSDSTDILNLLTSADQAPKAAAEGCKPPRPNRPDWWIPPPSTANYLLGGRRLCIDEAQHRAFLFFEGH
jgi:hypothetical protein